MVGVGRIELPTPAMSTQCSTTELYARTIRLPAIGTVERAFRQQFPRAQAIRRKVRDRAVRYRLPAGRRTGARPPSPDRASGTAWTGRAPAAADRKSTRLNSSH